MQYELLGTPKSLRRPRFTKCNRVYNSQCAEMFQDHLNLKSQNPYHKPYAQAVTVHVTFIFKVADHRSKAYKESMQYQPHTSKPDLDNLLKYLLDICTRAVYTDDTFVTSIQAEKIYGPVAKTVFTVIPL